MKTPASTTSRWNVFRFRRRRRLMVALRLLTVSAVVAATIAPPAAAATHTYSGASLFNGQWTDIGNWGLPNGIPNSSDDVVEILGNAIGGGWDPHVNQSYTINRLHFKDNPLGNPIFDVFGSRLYIGSGGIDNSSGTTQNVSTPITMNTDQSWNTGSPVNVYGSIAGSGAVDLTKVGNSALRLRAENTYAGDTKILDGTLVVIGAGRLSNSTDVSVSAGAEFNVQVSDAIWSLSGFGDVNLATSGANLVVGNYGNAGGTGTFSGDIVGPGNFSKRGTATHTWSGNAMHTGETRVEEGTLVAHSGALSPNSDLIVSSAGELEISGPGTNSINSLSGSGDVVLNSNSNLGIGILGQSTADDTFSGVLSGVGSITKRGTDKLTLTGANTYTGNTWVVEGTLRVSDGGSLDELTDLVISTNGTFELAGQQTVQSLGGPGTVVLEGGATELSVGILGQASPSTVFDGPITGAGSFKKQGTGTLIFKNSKSYTGGTTIGEGTLASAGSHVIPAGQLTIEADGVLDLNGFAETVGPGAVATTGLIMHGGAQIVNAGDFTVSTLGDFIDYRAGDGEGLISGAMRFATSSIARPIRVEDDASDVDLHIGANISNSTSNPNSSTPVVDKLGSGLLQFSGNNTFWRGVEVSEGTLRVNSDMALGNTVGDANTGTNVEDGATLELSSGRNIVGEHLTLAGGGVGGNGAMSSLGGSNSWTGPVVLADDSLVGVTSDVLTISGPVSGTGGLGKVGAGVLELSEANSYSGGTIVDGGTLLVTNTSGSATGSGGVGVEEDGTLGGDGAIGEGVQNQGTVSPGTSIGTLTFDDWYEQTATGSLAIEIDSSSNDVLAVGGAATLDGSIDVSWLGGHLPTLGETFEVMTYAGATGAFSSSSGLDAAAGLFLAPTYGATSLVLETVYAGDVNRDGKVDGLDANVVAANFLSNGVGFDNGDVNLDGTVNGLDANVIAANFLVGVPAHSVPEPSSFLLLVVGTVFVGSGSRRRRRS